MPETVTLSELEYHKLMRYTELVNATEAQAEIGLNQIKTRIAEVRKTREDYFNSLMETHPGLEKDIAYTPDEATFSLKPQVGPKQ